MSGKAHATLGASNAHRWMACPGSVRLAALAPPETDSEASKEGTAAHALAERCLRPKAPKRGQATNGVEVGDRGLTNIRRAADFIGQTFHGIEVDEDMAEAVQVYLDWAANKRDALELAYGSKPIAAIEEHIPLTWLRPGMFGTADLVLHTADCLWVVDYKHGRGVWVNVDDNPQLMFYGLGALRHFGGAHTRSVHVVVVQPRHPRGGVSSKRYAAAELHRWGQEVLGPAADVALSPEAPLVPGESQCHWCPAKAICPALRDHVAAEAQTDFALIPSGAAPPRAIDLEPDDLARILTATPLVEQWLKACADQAERLMLGGVEVPGYKLVESSPRRRWKNPETAAKALARLAGPRAAELVTRKLVSPAQAAKILGKKLTDAALATLVDKPAGVPTITKRDDKREEWSSAQADFTAEDPTG